MVKSKRSKKNSNADFKKPKIKLGRKLKRPLNESKTDFKTRKIILKDQLPVKNATLLSKKNSNIKEVLSHMTHHSVYVRQDGLNDLKSIVDMNAAKDLLPHLSSIVHGVSASICDADHLIRASSFKVIEALIVKMSVSFDPYFPILSSHLSCAMVSMNSNIQADSFTLMNILIKHRPTLLIKNSRTLLPKFLSLIAIKVSDSDSNKRRNVLKPSYVFNFAPESNTSSLKNRIKILKTLSLYLDALVNADANSDVNTPNYNWHIIMKGSLPSPSSEVKSPSEDGAILRQENELKSFFASLSPLLFHTWLEVKSNQLKGDGDEANHLNSVSYEILGCIIRIILQISKISEYLIENTSLKAAWPKEHLEAPILKILNGFPYVPATLSRNANEKKDFSIHDLNIGIALISLQLFEDKSKIKLKLAQYLTDLFESDFHDGQYKLEDVVSLSSYLLKGTVSLSPEHHNRILLAAFGCYQRSHPKAKRLFKPLFLCVLEKECSFLWRLDTFKNWIEELFCEIEKCASNESLHEVLLQMRLRNIPGFKEALLRHENSSNETLQKDVL